MTHEPSDASVAMLPCPFCGGSAEIISTTGTKIRCADDQCISRSDAGGFNFYNHKSEAMAAWNRRHHPSPQGVRVPDAVPMPDGDPSLHADWQENGYACGWNRCREETLFLNPQPGAPIKENEIYTKPIDAQPGAAVGDFDLLMKAVAEAEVKACACDFNHLESVTLFITKRYNELRTLATKDTP